MDRSKDAVADRVARAHYSIEPGLSLIVKLEAAPDREADPAEPVKLLEVNENTFSTGVQPLFFGPHPATGVFYPIVIIDITPEEMAEIRRDPTRLPNGWRLGREVWRRLAPAEAV